MEPQRSHNLLVIRKRPCPLLAQLMFKRIPQLSIAIVVLAGVVWLSQEDNGVPEIDAVHVPEPAASAEGDVAKVEAPAAGTAGMDADGNAGSMEGSEEGALEGKPEMVAATNLPEEVVAEEMMSLLPEWLLDSGEVRRERIQVAGHWVERARSRYAWDNGSFVEVEVTDLGTNATPEQFKSLGFDLEFDAEHQDQGIRLVDDGDVYSSNLEYDPEDAAGSIQMAVAGRFLMEVKLENLPLESVQAIEKRDGMFDQLLRHAAESNLEPAADVVP